MEQATEAQVNYINNLRNSILEEFGKSFDGNLYNSHFGKWMRKQVRQMKFDGIGNDRLERNAMVIGKFYPQWTAVVIKRLQFDVTQLSKSDASAIIDALKNPSEILRVEL